MRCSVVLALFSLIGCTPPASAPEPAPAPAAAPAATPAPSAKSALIDADLAGTWEESAMVAMPVYADQASCEEMEGTWEDSRCTMEGGSVVEIGERTEGGWPVHIIVVGSNGHTCDFTGQAVPDTDQDRLVANQSDCSVAITLHQGSLAAQATGSCSEICGMRAKIAIEQAKRR